MRTFNSLTLLLALLITVSVSVPHEITKENFPELFACEYNEFHSSKDQREWFVMFFAPWCGHCKRSKPVFNDFNNYLIDLQIDGAERDVGSIDEIMEKEVQVGTVDCTGETEICQYFNIRGYPTFYYLTSEKQAIAYNGPRTVDGFLNFTKYHDQQKGHLYVGEGFVNHGLFNLILQAVMQYWPYLIGFGLILPMFVGFGLATFLNARDQRKHRELIEKRKKQVQRQRQRGQQKEKKGGEAEGEGVINKPEQQQGEETDEKKQSDKKND